MMVNVMISSQIVTRLLKELYERILKEDADYSINIFLCGATPDKEDSIRSQINNRIKDFTKFNIVFPESIFSNLLFSKQYNLLTLEQELAKDVDVIILPIEGYGTMAELGAFASFPDFTKKIIVVNENKHKYNKRSFINIGPIELIRSQNKKNIIYYAKDSLGKMLDDVYRRLLYYSRRQQTKKEIKNLFTLSRFLLYVIAVFQPITKEEIEKHLKNWNARIPEYYIDPGLQILSQKGNIKMDFQEDQETYRLTSEGYHYVYDELCRQLGVRKVVSKLRSEVLHFQNRRIKTFDINKERERLLEVS